MEHAVQQLTTLFAETFHRGGAAHHMVIVVTVRLIVGMGARAGLALGPPQPLASILDRPRPVPVQRPLLLP